METEGPVVLLIMVDIILIDLVVDMVVHMVPQVVLMVVLQMIIIMLVEIAPPLQNLKDNVDTIDILNNMTNLKQSRNAINTSIINPLHCQQKDAKLYYTCGTGYLSITKRLC